MSKFIQEFNKFRLFLAFSSRLPLPMPKYDVKDLGLAMKYYPFVGFVLGVISFVLVYFISQISFISLSPSLYAILAMLIDVFLTGAIHIDGLADTSDGIFSYQNRERMLEIMKDSCVGTNAVLALIFYFLIKYAILTEIFTLYEYVIEDTWIFLVIPPVFARLSVLYSCAYFSYGRKEGMGKTFVDNTHPSDFIKVTFVLFTFLICISLFNESLMIPLFLSLLLVIVFSYYFNKAIEKKLGGSTGDTFGALLELSSLLAIFGLFIVI